MPDLDPIIVPDSAHVAAMKAAATNERDAVMVHVAFRTGVRVSELVQIAADDVFLSRRLVRVVVQKKRKLRRCAACGSALRKTNRVCGDCGADVAGAVAQELIKREERLVPLDQETVELLRRWISLPGRKRGTPDRLFPVTRQHAWEIFTTLAERAGLPQILNRAGKLHKVSPHQLRHAHATTSLRHDNSPQGLARLQARLGHANVSTTMGYVEQDLESQLEDVDRIFGGGEDQ